MGLPVLICAIRNDNPKDFDKVKAVKCLIEHGADGRAYTERYGLNDVEAEELVVGFLSQ